MKISKRENNMLKIAVEISKERSGVPVLLADLRERVPMSKTVFDQAIQTMVKNGYFLTRNAHPTGSLTDAEKEMMIPDGAGNFFFAINIRDDAVILKEKPTAGPARGGKREGSGRPAVKSKFQKQQAGRLPGWIVDWLKTQPGKPADIIEAALIEKYGLTPPEK